MITAEPFSFAMVSDPLFATHFIDLRTGLPSFVIFSGVFDALHPWLTHEEVVTLVSSLSEYRLMRFIDWLRTQEAG